MMEQMSLGIDISEERKAFELVYPEFKNILHDAPIDSGILNFREIGNCSSVSFMDSGEIVFQIRIRKKTNYILIPEKYESMIPFGTNISKSKSNPGMVRISIQSYEDILKYVSVLRSVLENVCRKHRDFGCCSRYEECSDAKKCVHPDPKFALSCWYRSNLADGKIFYGKNKNT